MRFRIAAFLLLANVGCAAHFQRVTEPTVDFEPMWLGAPLVSDHLFDAQFPLHLFLYNGLDRPDAMDVGGFGAALSFSFIARVRMLTTASTPVLPPSYTPRLRLQLIETFRLGEDGPRDVQRLLGAVGLTAAHYSNGQMGCILKGGVLRDGATSDFDCLWPDGQTTELNLQNGSFTGHLVAGDLLVRWLRFPAAGGAPRASLAAKVGVEWMVPCDFSGCMEPPLRDRYGDLVLRWQGIGELVVVGHRHRGIPIHSRWASDARVRVTASGAHHRGLGKGRTPFSDTTLEAAYLTHFEQGGVGGPFVRYHRGRDDLNIRFEESWNAWTIGYQVEFTAPLLLQGTLDAPEPLAQPGGSNAP